MRLGDLVEWGGQRWIVRRVERDTRICILHDGKNVETIPDDLDKLKPGICQVIANPPNDWPNVSLTSRPKFGRIVNVQQPTLGGTHNLEPLHDWMVADPLQPGGAIFFNPILRLKYGDQLLAIYERGRARIEIPREFLSTAQRIAKAQAPEPEPRKISVYDRLRRNEFADDDE